MYISQIVMNSGGDIFVMTAIDGIFRSTDDGATWDHLSLNDAPIYSIAINHSGVIFVGTQGGVFRSRDQGNSWVLKIIDPNDNFSIDSFATSSPGELYAASAYMVFRSSDEGETWTQSNKGMQDQYIRGLAINSRGHIFAGSSNMEGVFRSADNGETWIPTDLDSVNAMVIAINSQDHIFVATEFEAGVLRSLDNGNTWAPINNGLQERGRVNAIAFNALGEVFLGDTVDGVFRSRDNGNNWQQTNLGLPGAEYISSFTFTSNGEIFAGTFGGQGIFRSADQGRTWEQVRNDLGYNEIYALFTNSQDHIFAGTYTGIYRSTNHGNNWERSALQDVQVTCFIRGARGYIFAGTGRWGVFRSRDEGQTWEKMSSDLDDIFIHDLAANSRGDVYAVTQSGLYLSTTDAESWIATSLTNIGIFCIDINQSDHVFVGENSGAGLRGHIFRSIDGGLSWTQTELS